jgi:hypothetical protein
MVITIPDRADLYALLHTDVAFVLGDDAGLMVRAFSATVGDSQLLVQRAMLDLMVVHFPIGNG